MPSSAPLALRPPRSASARFAGCVGSGWWCGKRPSSSQYSGTTSKPSRRYSADRGRARPRRCRRRPRPASRRGAEPQPAAPRARGTRPITSRESHRLHRRRRGSAGARAHLDRAQRGDRRRRTASSLPDHDLEAVVLGRVVAAGDHHAAVERRGGTPRSRAPASAPRRCRSRRRGRGRPSVQRGVQPRRRQPAVAADRDAAARRRGRARARGRARGRGRDQRVVEVAVGDAADVVLAEDARVHAQVPRRRRQRATRSPAAAARPRSLSTRT